MILRKKKKERNVQEEPIKLSKTNIHSLTPFVSPLGNLSGFLILIFLFHVFIGPIKSSIPSHEITNQRRVSLSLYIYIYP